MTTTGPGGSARRVTVLSGESTVLRDQVARHTTPHEVLPKSDRLAGRVDVLELPNCRLVFVRYGGEVVVEAPAIGERTVATVPLGPMHVEQDRRHERTTHTEPFLLSRTGRTLMRPDAWAGSWVVSPDEAHLRDHRRLVLGQPTTVERDGVHPLRPVVVPDGDQVLLAGRNDMLAQACRQAWAVHDLPEPTPGAVRDAFIHAVESNLLTALVIATAGEDHAGDDTSGDDRVDLLLEWLEVNYAFPVTVAEMAKVSGLSVRHLQASVQRVLGHSPTEVLREIRLRHAQRMLLEGTPTSTTVATVALHCGVLHMGRFAQQYRARFGEPPSATLSKGRRR